MSRVSFIVNASAAGHTRTGSSLRLLPFGDRLVGGSIPFGCVVLGFYAMSQELETNVTTYSSFCDCQHYQRLNPSRHFRYLWPDKAKDWIDRVLFLGEL